VAAAAQGGRSGKVLIVPRPDSAHRHLPGPVFGNDARDPLAGRADAVLDLVLVLGLVVVTA
jgi:hypothetical protein